MRHEPPIGGVRGVFATWSPEDSIRAAELTLDRLESHGVGLDPPNRLERALELVRRADLFDVQYDPVNRTTEIAVAEAHKTIFEHYVIMKDLQPATSIVRRKLRVMLKGDDDSTEIDLGDEMNKDDPLEWPCLLAGGWTATPVLYGLVVWAYFKPIRVGSSLVLIAAVLLGFWLLVFVVTSALVILAEHKSKT